MIRHPLLDLLAPEGAVRAKWEGLQSSSAYGVNAKKNEK
jgi:hypothetical protein